MMNIDGVTSLTNEAEVRVYLREVGRQHGALGLLQVATTLAQFGKEIVLRAEWAMDEVRAIQASQGAKQ